MGIGTLLDVGFLLQKPFASLFLALCGELGLSLIHIYAAHTPKDADLFFLSLKKGDSVTIGGWIGETTTIR